VAEFALSLAGFAEKAAANVSQVVRKVSLSAMTDVVLRSPVDTGRFRANWNTSIGGMDASTASPPDKSGQAAIARGTAHLATADGLQDIFITNSLPYAIPLEYGHSKQAPAGMVRITVTQRQAFISKAVAELPQ